MKILLSPAKSLNLEEDYPKVEVTIPEFLDKTEKVFNKVKKMSPKKLGELMSISQNLSELNYSRYQDFDINHTADNSRPAIYTFDGDVYDGLNAYDLQPENIQRLQHSLRILSGLYGMLKPLDLIQPYRLEMGTSLKIYRADNLYQFWKKDLTKTLNDELKEGELVVDLASKEYSKAIDLKKLKGKVIEPVFKDYSKGKLRVISFFAKKARGAMTRYLSNFENLEYADILKFNEDDYAFSKSETRSELKPVFVR
mgnify:CR=1 FL=1